MILQNNHPAYLLIDDSQCIVNVGNNSVSQWDNERIEWDCNWGDLEVNSGVRQVW